MCVRRGTAAQSAQTTAHTTPARRVWGSYWTLKWPVQPGFLRQENGNYQEVYKIMVTHICAQHIWAGKYILEAFRPDAYL